MNDAISGETPRLVRFHRGSVFLHFEPPMHCKCGGEIEVKDWAYLGSCGEMRYEAWCTKCLTCDPNGWATQAEVVENAPRYFNRAS